MRKLLLLVLIGIQAQLHAQVSIGPRGGISIFTTAFSSDLDDVAGQLNENTEQIEGISAALAIEVMLGDHIALQPEVGYTMKGASYRVTNMILTNQLNYADLTLLWKGRIGRGRLQPAIFAGPGIGVGITARQILQRAGGFGGSDQSSNFEGTLFAPTEFYLAGGAGFSYTTGNSRLFLNYRYLHGTSNIYRKPIVAIDVTGAYIGEVMEHNRGSIISIGCLIPLSRKVQAPVEETN